MKRVTVKLSDLELVACYGAVGFFFLILDVLHANYVHVSLSLCVFVHLGYSHVTSYTALFSFCFW